MRDPGRPAVRTGGERGRRIRAVQVETVEAVVGVGVQHWIVRTGEIVGLVEVDVEAVVAKRDVCCGQPVPDVGLARVAARRGGWVAAF